jgi:hypothetical protein
MLSTYPEGRAAQRIFGEVVRSITASSERVCSNIDSPWLLKDTQGVHEEGRLKKLSSSFPADRRYLPFLQLRRSGGKVNSAP